MANERERLEELRRKKKEKRLLELRAKKNASEARAESDVIGDLSVGGQTPTALPPLAEIAPPAPLTTAVDPSVSAPVEYSQTNVLGLLPIGTTQSVVEKTVGAPLSLEEGLPGRRLFQNDTAETIRRVAANTVIGAQSFIPSSITAPLEDPVGVIEGLARLYPELSKKLSIAVLGGYFKPTVGVPGPGTFVQVGDDEKSDVRRGLGENPFEIILAAAPLIKGFRGTGKAVTAESAVSAPKIKPPSKVGGVFDKVGAAVKKSFEPFQRPELKLGNSPFAESIRRSFTNAQTEAGMIVARNMALFEQSFAENLSISRRAFSGIKNRRFLRSEGDRLIQNPRDVKSPNKNVQAFVDDVAKIYEDIGTELEAIGHKVVRGGELVPFTKRDNYFTHQLTPRAAAAIESQSGPIYDAIVSKSRVKGFDRKAYIQGSQQKIGHSKYGPVDFSRDAYLPRTVEVNGKTVRVLESDPLVVIPRYIDQTAKKIALAKEFGENPEIAVRELAKKLRDQEGSVAANALSDMWMDANGISPDTFNRNNPVFKFVAQPVSELMRSFQLSLSVVPNVTSGLLPSTVKFGPMNTLRALLDSVKPSVRNGTLAEARLNGGWAKDVISNTYSIEDLSGIAGQAGKAGLRATGLNLVNRNINKVASLAAIRDVERGLGYIRDRKSGFWRQAVGLTEKEYMAKLKKDFNWNDGDINRMVRKGLTTADRARVYQRATEMTNVFRETGATRPRWMSKYGWRQIMAYTSFSRAKGNIFANAIGSAKRGNVKPLAVLLAGDVAAGEGIIAIKNWLKGQERKDESIYIRLLNDLNYAATFGLFGDISQRFQYAAPYENPLTVTPPQMEALWSLSSGILQGATDQDLDKVKKGAERAIPLYKAILNLQDKITGGGGVAR